MTSDSAKKFQKTLSDVSQFLMGKNRGKKTALVTGSVALGALVTSAVLGKVRRTSFPLPEQLPPAMDAEIREMEIMEGPARYYVRRGRGTPIVLLHSINAAASSFEMKPLFEHFCATTERPVYALDWFGFGLSSRPPVHYTPGLYQRQLRRFLSEHVEEQADIIALSLSCEYAATVASAFPVLIRRLVCVSPTGLGSDRSEGMLSKVVVGTASGIGAFEIFFSRLTRRESIRQFYREQIFAKDAPVPESLVEYAYISAHSRGSHYAPRWFVDGSLFMDEYARRIYINLKTNALFLIPSKAPRTIQSFDRAAEVQALNPQAIQLKLVPTGLLPHWEKPEEVFPLIDSFLE